MIFEITGTIRYVGEVQNLEMTNGKNFTKREVLIESNEQIPESVLLELINENALGFTGVVGQRATANFHIHSRQNASGRFFSCNKAWKIQIHY